MKVSFAWVWGIATVVATVLMLVVSHFLELPVWFPILWTVASVTIALIIFLLV